MIKYASLVYFIIGAVCPLIAEIVQICLTCSKRTKFSASRFMFNKSILTVLWFALGLIFFDFSSDNLILRLGTKYSYVSLIIIGTILIFFIINVFLIIPYWKEVLGKIYSGFGIMWFKGKPIEKMFSNTYVGITFYFANIKGIIIEFVIEFGFILLYVMLFEGFLVSLF